MSLREREKIQTLPWKECVKVIALTLFFFIFCIEACLSSRHPDEICESKISHSLQSKLAGVGLEEQIAIVVTLKDSAGVKTDFPSLRIANPQIALGHLVKHEIFALCRRKNIEYIDIPKTLYPNN